jgi:rhodanese-related sulfurtransferase
MVRYGFVAGLAVATGLVIIFWQQLHSAAYHLALKRMILHNAPAIDVRQARLNSDEALFLDARAREEYEVSHLPKARWVGFEEFGEPAVRDLPLDRPIIVYCSVGYRSDLIAARMQEMGFSNVENMYGGIFEWVNRGHPVYRDGMPTDSVHAYSKRWGIWLRKGEKVFSPAE